MIMQCGVKENISENKIQIPNHLDKLISYTLFHLGIKSKVKGFNYLFDAIKTSIIDPSSSELITKRLYIDLARKYSKTPASIERAIRTAIGSMPVTKYRYIVFAGNMGHYSNKEFIIHIAKYICYKN